MRPPPIPLGPCHTLPAPTTFILASVTSVLGTAEPSSRCHGSRWREPAHWLLAERRKKARSVRGRVPSARLPLFSVSCWLGHINRARGGGQRPAGTAHHSCGHCRGNGGPPEVNVISFSLKCEVCEGQKQRPSRRVGCLFLHLELL